MAETSALSVASNNKRSKRSVVGKVDPNRHQFRLF